MSDFSFIRKDVYQQSERFRLGSSFVLGRDNHAFSYSPSFWLLPFLLDLTHIVLRDRSIAQTTRKKLINTMRKACGMEVGMVELIKLQMACISCVTGRQK